MANGVVMVWEEAARLLGERVAALSAARPVVVVGITGPVGAGKSTLARALSACIISTDHYLPDYAAVPYEERDHPARADLPRLAADLAAIRAGRAASIPQWSFHEHRRTGYAEVRPAPVVVCEGIHALHELPRAELDLKVYIEAARATRWARWEAIERAGQRGMGVERARAFFDRVAEPAFAARAAEYRAAADVIVLNG